MKELGMKSIAISAAIALVVGLLLGMLAGAAWEGRRGDAELAAAVKSEQEAASRLVSERDEIRKRAELMQIHLRLGQIAMEANRQNYGTAAEQAGSFFEDVAAMNNGTQGTKGDAALRQILASRDEIVAGLATAQPAAAQSLQQLYLSFFDLAY